MHARKLSASADILGSVIIYVLLRTCHERAVWISGSLTVSRPCNLQHGDSV
jgi:hypothetical protein